MKELTEDKFYTILAEKYDVLQLDYVLLSFDGDYRGGDSHKEAVAEAISVLGRRTRVGNRLNPSPFSLREEEMRGAEYDREAFFRTGRKEGDDPYMTYWRAFIDPPYGVPYSEEDFNKLNHALFPVQFRDDLEIYCWNDDFSDYFDDGREWWGNALWSVYDKWMNRFVVIGASLTD